MRLVERGFWWAGAHRTGALMSLTLESFQCAQSNPLVRAGTTLHGRETTSAPSDERNHPPDQPVAFVARFATMGTTDGNDVWDGNDVCLRFVKMGRLRTETTSGSVL
jgi:hypothetical protein